ncbi:MAG: hypothetical protein JJT96_08435 [Opitutales bacterium]|nr:hypothetical protein [Opitutales bacterium]
MNLPVLLRILACLVLLQGTLSGSMRTLRFTGEVADSSYPYWQVGDRHETILHFDDSVIDAWDVRRDTGIFPGAIRRIDVRLFVGNSTRERRMRMTAFDGDVRVVDRFEPILLVGQRTGDYSAIDFTVTSHIPDPLGNGPGSFRNNTVLWDAGYPGMLNDLAAGAMFLYQPAGFRDIRIFFHHEQRHPFINKVQMAAVPPFEQPLVNSLPTTSDGTGANQTESLLRLFLHDPTHTTSDDLGSAGILITTPSDTVSPGHGLLLTIDAIDEITPATTAPACPWVQLQPAFVGDGGTLQVILNIPEPAPPGGQTFTLSSVVSGMVLDPAVVVIPEGQTQVRQPVQVSAAGIPGGGRAITTVIQAVGTAYPGCRATALLTVERESVPALQALEFLPHAVVGGRFVTGLVTLDQPAGDLLFISLMADGYPPELSALPDFVVVHKGQTQGIFVFPTGAVSASTVHTVHAMDGYSGASQSASLTILPDPDVPVLADLILNPASLVGGEISTATVFISAPAPLGGQAVAIAVEGPATAPATLIIPQGETGATFSVQSQTVSVVEVAPIRVSVGSESLTRHLGVFPEGDSPRAVLTALRVEPRVLTSGETAVGVVELNMLATSETTIHLSSFSRLLGFPSTVMIPWNQQFAAFPVETRRTPREARAVLTAALEGIGRSAIVDLGPSTRPILQEVVVSAPAVIGPGVVDVTLVFDRPAPSGGEPIRVEYAPFEVFGFGEERLLAEGESQLVFSLALPEPTHGGYLAEITASTGLNAAANRIFVRREAVDLPPGLDTYTAWVARTFDTSAALDPEISGPAVIVPGQGLPNIARYLLGEDATRSGFRIFREGESASGAGTGILLEIPWNRMAPDYLPVIEGSSDLIHWTTLPPDALIRRVDETFDDLDGPFLLERLEVAPGNSFRFFRVQFAPTGFSMP